MPRYHTWTDEELAEAVAQSTSWTQVGRKLHARRDFAKQYALALGLDASHFPYRQGGKGPLTERERSLRHQAAHKARRQAFYASRGGVCERCGEKPHTAVWREPGRGPVRLQKILNSRKEKCEELLPQLVVVCYQCYLDDAHNGRPHGSLSRYAARGCRCPLCLQGRADYEQTRRLERNGVSKRPRWKYGNVMLPSEKTAHLWYTESSDPTPTVDWWSDLARGTVADDAHWNVEPQ